MTHDEIRAILTVCLLASFADGEKHDREREQIRQVAEGLAGDQAINLPGLYQDVLLRRVNLESAVARLVSSEARQLAYEMAVCVCDADGHTSVKEDAFLAQLRQALGQGTAATGAVTGAVAGTAAGAAAALASTYGQFDAQAHAVADAPVQVAAAPEAVVQLPASVAAPHPAAVDALPQNAAQRRPSTLSVEEMDSKILKASILNGAIELLPENLSTLAIIPLQMRLVYQIGQSYGYQLDSGHIKDFLATLGVGLTSQYLEQAVSSGMSFASTYALGHVANQYYASGRQLTTDMLKAAYQHVMQDGRQLQSQYLPQMQETARGLNTAKIMSMVRGG